MSWNGNINELEGRMCWKRDRKEMSEKLREKIREIIERRMCWKKQLVTEAGLQLVGVEDIV